MPAQLRILDQLYERLKLVKEDTKALVYGFHMEDNIAVLLSCVVENNKSAHPVDWLLVAPMIPVAVLRDAEQMPASQYIIEVANKEVSVKSILDDEDIEFEVVSQEYFQQNNCAARIHFKFNLLGDNDVPSVAEKLLRRISNGNTFFLHKPSKTVIPSSQLDISDDKRTLIRDLIEDEPKNAYSPVSDISLNLMLCDPCVTNTVAPTCSRISNDTCSVIKGETVAYLPKYLLASNVGSILHDAVVKMVNMLRYWTTVNSKVKCETVTVLPYRTGHLFTLVYPTDRKDSELVEYRKTLNESLLLPPTAPFMSRMNNYEFVSDKKAYHLYNTHIGLVNLPTSSESDAILSITKGIYSYHHYMQDSFDDNRWGCAYRSLQTIVSWFRHQGYTAKEVPSHRQIQQSLVACGDKPSKFVGTKDWIGSMEVGYVLENYLGVTSRFVSVARGDEMYEKARELVHHFKTQGTPIMIGGGVLAHTILGVWYDPDTADTQYLILDPHYTGGEDLGAIHKGGWCGWKPASFWKASAFYNLCLPQRPNVV